MKNAGRRAFRAIHIVPLLAGLILLAGLLPVSVGGYYGVRSNTARLLNDNRDAVLDGLEEQLRSTFVSAAAQAALVGRYLERPDVDPEDVASITAFMLGAATSQESLEAFGYIGATGPLRRWARGATAVQFVDRALVANAEQLWNVKNDLRKGSWSAPIVSAVTGRGLVAYRYPVVRDGKVAGVLLAAINWDVKSQMLMSQSANLVPFALFGRDRVFIHPNMASIRIEGTELPRLDAVDDPYLAVIWKDPRETTFGGSPRSRVHWTWTGRGFEARVYAYREIEGYDDTPWLIGYHQSSTETFIVRWVVQAIFYGSITMVILGVLVSWWLARRAVRPVAEIAAAARALERLDFAGVSSHLARDSRLREISETSHALQSAARALDRVQTYVPRALVSQVMTMDADATRSADRDVTVLFMDLAGYTRYSEGRSAAEVGAYLNRIFGCVGPVIERNGGSIDKYTGDGLMAVWGAPAPDPDHARRAWEAAIEVLAAARERVACDLRDDPGACRIRFGLHSGRVLAGDVGFAGRLDYTVIGRTVNIAQRTQAALRDHMKDDTAALAVTATTASRLSLPPSLLEPIGQLVHGEMVFRFTG
jgi:class 3 adenylate cyclase